MIKFEISKEFESLVSECFEKWGYADQLLVLSEEFGELVKILNHERRNNKYSSSSLIKDEIVDCFIMLMEFVVFFRFSFEDLNPTIIRKLDRVRRYLKKPLNQKNP